MSKASFDSWKEASAPFLVRRRVLDGASETSEDGAFHGETNRDVVEGSYDTRCEEQGQLRSLLVSRRQRELTLDLLDATSHATESSAGVLC